MNREQRRQWRRCVLACPDLTHGERLVLLALEMFADFPSGTDARPGVAVLAEVCGCGTRVVERALHEGRRLKLIEQTARANPKRGLAAVYRLLPAPLSTRTSVHVETDFNPHETDFNPHESVISTRTTVQPPNKDHQAINTKAARAREPVPVDPIGIEAAATAGQLVTQLIGPRYPRRDRAKLQTLAAELITDGTPVAVVAEALQRWLTKPGFGAAILPGLVSDVIRSRNGRPLQGADLKVAQYQALKDLDQPPTGELPC